MHTDPSESPLRLAVLTESISHFEVPLFRLCARREDLVFKVFYVQKVDRQRFDAQYAGRIDWGDDLLAGYESAQGENADALRLAARAWGADVVLMYGYGWPGALEIIVRNWWRGQAQVHRGTLNYFLDPRRPLKGRLMRPFRSFVLRMFDAHHYGGDYSRKVLMDAGAKESSLFFVPYSVDTEHFLAASESAQVQEAALALRTDQGWADDDHVILFIAQHNWFKGPDIAMETFHRVASKDPRARFLIVGSGRMTDAMKAEVCRHVEPSRIHFAGFVPSLQTVPYYLACDVVLCSSRYETWARMINEAMLCRRPCVVSRVVPAAGGLIEDGVNGYVVESPEADLLSNAMTRHFALPVDERHKMGEAARRQAQFFAYEPNMENVIAATRYAFERRGGVKALP